MGLWDKLTNEFIDVIEWTDDSQDTMVWRFPRYNNEIKYGAQLTVRESQTAIFVNEGSVADVFGPGMYELITENMPIMTTLNSWKHGFESPFKAEVYFVNTKNFIDLKWGTVNPIMLRDPEFGPLRLRAFGTYAIKISDPLDFIGEIMGTDGRFQVGEVSNQLRNIIITRFTDIIGQSKIPILDLASNYNELSKFLQEKIQPEFKEYGLDLTKFLVENISLPPKVEEVLDKRTSMGIVGDLNKYTQFQTAEAIEKAAQNPGGGASDGMGLGMGFAMANQMMNQHTQQQQQQSVQPTGNPATPPATPPPLPKPLEIYVAQDNQQTGPFDKKALKGLISSGALQKDTLVWQAGMEKWQEAATVTTVANLFGTTPPPLPPQ